MENLQIINNSLRVVPEKKWYGGGVAMTTHKFDIHHGTRLITLTCGKNSLVRIRMYELYKRQKCQALHSQKTSL
jgi:hypothetical protein